MAPGQDYFLSYLRTVIRVNPASYAENGVLKEDTVAPFLSDSWGQS